MQPQKDPSLEEDPETKNYPPVEYRKGMEGKERWWKEQPTEVAKKTITAVMLYSKEIIINRHSKKQGQHDICTAINNVKAEYICLHLLWWELKVVAWMDPRKKRQQLGFT